MTREHNELLYSIAAGWAWGFIVLFLIWLFVVLSLVPQADDVGWFAILVFLGAGALTGSGYLRRDATRKDD